MTHVLVLNTFPTCHYDSVELFLVHVSQEEAAHRGAAQPFS